MAPHPSIDDAVLANVVRSAGDAFGVIDEAGTVRFANPFANRLLGYAPGDLDGRNLAELVHPDDLVRGIEMVATSLDDDPDDHDSFSPPVLIRALQADGGYRYVYATGGVVGRDGDLTLLSVLLRPADDFLGMHATLRALLHGGDARAALGTIPEIIRWHDDRPLVALAYRDEAGCHVLGDPLPSAFDGSDPGAGDSPWGRAWRGEEARGAGADLPAPLAEEAAAHGLVDYWVRPVWSGGPDPDAVVTLWHAATNRSLLAWELNLDFMVDAASLALAHLDRRRRLEHAASHDALTGLANRTAFHQAVEAAAAEGSDAAAAVLYIDLDGFKPVNDHLGHAVGDLVLAEVAARLGAVCRADDVVARLGGDEFCVLRVGATEDEAVALAEALVVELARPHHLDGVVGAVRGPDEGTGEATAVIDEPVAIGASVGVAVGPISSVGSLVGAADRALYHAKGLGGRVAHIDRG